jgi:hypothetical protein
MKANTYDKTCREINWPELAKQKQTLLKVKKSLKGQEKKHLEGILQLLDKLQDAAELHGVKETDIYPSLHNVRLIAAAKQAVN